MLVMSLNAEPAIMVKKHLAFQKLYFITRFLRGLHRNFILFLQALHKSVHDKITFSNNQNVIHMNEGIGIAAVVGGLENAWAWSMCCQLSFQVSHAKHW